MTDLKTQAQQLIELNEKRTPGEWEYDWNHYDYDGGGSPAYATIYVGEEDIAEYNIGVRKNDNAAFIAHTANHASAIAQAYLDKCEEVERLRQALQNVQDITDCREGRSVGQAVDSCYSANEFARQALGASND